MSEAANKNNRKGWVVRSGTTSQPYCVGWPALQAIAKVYRFGARGRDIAKGRAHMNIEKMWSITTWKLAAANGAFTPTNLRQVAMVQPIWQEDEFNSARLGFQKRTGAAKEFTETYAIHKAEIQRNLVPEGGLGLDSQREVGRRTSPELSKDAMEIIKTMLHEIKIRIKGDLSKTEGMLERGVYQASPLNPALFNVYMDTYTVNAKEKMAEQEHQEHPFTWEVVPFSDGVKPEATATRKFQELLELSITWSIQFGMTWNTDKCKRMA